MKIFVKTSFIIIQHKKKFVVYWPNKVGFHGPPFDLLYPIRTESGADPKYIYGGNLG